MGPGLKDACSWWGVVLLVGLVYLQATSGDTSARIVGCAVCLVAKAYGLMLGDVRNGILVFALHCSGGILVCNGGYFKLCSSSKILMPRSGLVGQSLSEGMRWT